MLKSLVRELRLRLGRLRVQIVGEIQDYMFEKAAFPNAQSVRKWLDQHLKTEIKTLLDFRAWDEWRRRFMNAYMEISEVSR